MNEHDMQAAREQAQQANQRMADSVLRLARGQITAKEADTIRRQCNAAHKAAMAAMKSPGG